MKNDELFRGWIVFVYDREHTVETAKMPNGQEIWQDRDALEEGLKSRIRAIRDRGQMMPIDLQAHVEIITTEIIYP